MTTTIDPKSGHYDAGGIETLAILKAKLTAEQYEGFLLGNMLKYGTRANHKGSFERDIEKAAVYATLLKEHRAAPVRCDRNMDPAIPCSPSGRFDTQADVFPVRADRLVRNRNLPGLTDAQVARSPS